MEWGKDTVLKKNFGLLHDKPSTRETESAEQGIQEVIDALAVYTFVSLFLPHRHAPYLAIRILCSLFSS